MATLAQARMETAPLRSIRSPESLDSAAGGMPLQRSKLDKTGRMGYPIGPIQSNIRTPRFRAPMGGIIA
ncbi:MAG: hypothetical protein D6759_02200 [Chloroflexi bacterium]|nr:MAG: hypothetical protein D6759_02200 [Chloroflexota bacterium]